MKKILFNKTILSWALYDWANSAFATTVTAGFFPIFYASLSSNLSTQASQFWFNITLASSSLLIAIAAPILGAIADHGGNRKKFLATFAMLGILMSAGLAWVGAGMWWVGLLIYGLGQIGFSGANIFYNAMLTDLSSEEDFDIVSSYGYALGYAGGGILFLVNVLMVTQPQLFGLADSGTALSLSFISVAIWWAIFTVPLLWVIEEKPAKLQTTWLKRIRRGFQQLRITYHELRQLKMTLLFLVGYWLYIDGVNTVYKMAIFFANRVLELPKESLINALLLTQFVSFPGALFFGWLGKRIGSKLGILIGLLVYTLAVFYAWRWLDSAAGFYKLAIAIGLVQGGVQGLSRSLFARLIPKSKTTEFFGFFSIAGKFATVLGPLMMAAIPLLFAHSDVRDSILVLIILFTAGGYILLKINVKNGMQAARDIESK